MIRFDPKNSVCVECSEPFEQTVLPQGGGRTKIYCSSNCRANSWARGNSQKRKISVKKYESRPISKEKKRERRLKQLYGITQVDYIAILKRQRNRCLGCMVDFSTILTNHIHIDHDHKTGKVRGLLCNSCNQALGLLKDDEGTMYRLSAYLHRDINKYMVYIIGSLRNPKITSVAKKVREAGFDAFDNWISVGPNADDHWQKYETDKGLTYIEALKGRSARHVFNYDRAYLDLCDAALMVMPGGKSAHLELGYVIAQKKPGFILLEAEPDRYDVMPQFAWGGISHNLDELIEKIKFVKEGGNG